MYTDVVSKQISNVTKNFLPWDLFSTKMCQPHRSTTHMQDANFEIYQFRGFSVLLCQSKSLHQDLMRGYLDRLVRTKLPDEDLSPFPDLL